MKSLHNPDQNIITLSHVSFSYGSDPILKDISLSVHKGDYLGVIGPNGSGKSTLVKLIMGLIAPSEGDITLFGEPAASFQEKWRVGYVSQKAALFDATMPLTVAEVVAMGRYARRGLFHRLHQEDKEKTGWAMEQVEMKRYQNRRISDLSGGQQQRVFIARALAGEPEVIILDEPTVGVDVKAQEQFYTLLQRLNRDLGLTLLMVSHELDVIAHEATELACINKTLVYHGNPKDFMAGNYFEKLYGKGVKFVLHE